MSGQIQALVEQIMSASAVSAGDSSRATSPYFKYGKKYFQTNEGLPPQVRWQPTTFNLTKTEKRPEHQSTGSLATINQDLECTIWGETEDQVLQEFSFICAGINRIKGTLNNEVISQPPIFETISGEWVDTSAFNSYGEMLRINYRAKVSLKEPSGSYTSVLLLTASIGLSGSALETSSSYQGFRNITVTGSNS